MTIMQSSGVFFQAGTGTEHGTIPNTLTRTGKDLEKMKQ